MHRILESLRVEGLHGTERDYSRLGKTRANNNRRVDAVHGSS